MQKNSYVNISFVDDKEMQKLNKKYRKKDKTTDVLSFSLNEKDTDGKFHLGDIVVNIEQAKRQAANFGLEFESEVSELVAHGMLHLQGVHHDGDDH